MTRVISGILLPESVLHTPFFQVLALFVAFNTIMYVSLAIGKMLPRIRLHRRAGNAVGRHGDPETHPDVA